MSFDGLTLSAVVAELTPILQDARIQKVVLVDDLTLALETFAPGVGRASVLLSADLDASRVHRITALPRRGVERDTPFALLARKHLRNARIVAVRQPPLERVVALACEQRESSGRHLRVTCIVEAMGRRSNLVLADEHGTILDAARRAAPSRNPRRPVLPHLPYSDPPPQTRLLPDAATAATLEDLAVRALADAGPSDAPGESGEAVRTSTSRAAARRPATLARFLSETLAGLSPLAGQELAHRATGDVRTPLVASLDWTRVADLVRDLFAPLATGAWQPTIARDAEGAVLGYAPYELTHLVAAGARLDRFASISAAIEAAITRGPHRAPLARGDALAAERKALLTPLARAVASAERRASALDVQLSSGHAQREPLRRAGDAILLHQTSIPPGATELVVDGEHIALDPLLSPSENAQAYFARYRKAREAEERVPELLEHAQQHLMHLRDLHALVETADSMDAVRALRREVSAAVGGRADAPAPPSKNRARQNARAPARSSGPYRRVSLDGGWEALVGSSAGGNVAVTFDLAQPDDVWLHARNVPGAHVIVRCAGKTPPDAVIERAAEIAAHFSAAHAASAVEVDAAPRRFVKKIPGGAAGLVRYSNERTLRVRPRA